MIEHNFRRIDQKWQKYWKENRVFESKEDKSKPKFYSLDMFPYPSGAGLHVGHPLGYIASDVVSRYKRAKGFNVLHPMGFDAFGLPAEQYAIQTGQHPATTTEKNIKRYKEQLTNIGFSYDWSREVRTSDPHYYKWTQWIFMQLFNHYYDKKADMALPIDSLVSTFEKEGNLSIEAVSSNDTLLFSDESWKGFSEKKKSDILLHYRLTYLAETEVNWCPVLGTVLANDEVKDGFSERGGHPIERKKMKQWVMRITAYADRLLSGLDKIDWSEATKEMQRNWIGKSLGCSLNFKVQNLDITLTVFTTRVDTTFGVTYLSIAPEHNLVRMLTTDAQKRTVESYVYQAKNQSERNRMANVKTVSGVFTGSYAINPFNYEKIPIWIADYVLVGYGTGVIMGVPSSDKRDYLFASHFGIPIVPVQEGIHCDITQDNFDPKAGTMINSGFLNGLTIEKAIPKAIEWAESNKIGFAKVNYKMRDAVFSRQRYWGEPIPIYYENNIPKLIKEEDLPLNLPEVDEYLPTETADPPLGRAKDWKYEDQYEYELNTMPGWAGSSWYQFRYMDPSNKQEFVNPEKQAYWENVDLYIGGSEHATGHLLYSRFWTKFLYDIRKLTVDEPFKKLINQGMIQGTSALAYWDKKENRLVSYGLRHEHDCTPIHVDVNMVKNNQMDVKAFKAWRPYLADAELVLESGKFICGSEVEKMSKSKFNVVNPDDIIENYGADTLRMYEMFLGPLEQFKPWNTNGIDGVFKFLKKTWRLFYTDNNQLIINDNPAKEESLKTIHRTIKKIGEDLDRYSFNTPVSEFMICVNELTAQNCHNKEVLGKLTVILSPYAPHICEEFWNIMGNKGSLADAQWPDSDEKYLLEAAYNYPIMVNGKMRAKINFSVDKSHVEIEAEVKVHQTIQKWLGGKEPKKIIIVPKRVINVVV